MKILSHKKGFTLVELIIVVSIIAVLASLAFMALSGETAQARDSKRLSDLKTFEDAIATSNGKNKKIDYAGLGTIAGPVTTNTGDLYPLRGAYLVQIQNGLFDSDVIPTIPRDPKGAQYIGAFFSTTDYQLLATKENSDTKIETALVRGSFKEGAIIDVLTADTDDAYAAGEYIDVANPSRFIAGDIIKVDSEYMVVMGANTVTKRVYVFRDASLPAAGAGTSPLKVHNKGTSIKLYDSAPGAESLVCLGGVTARAAASSATTNADDSGAVITVGTPNTFTTTAAASADAWGRVCTTATNLITDDGTVKPYTVVTQ